MTDTVTYRPIDGKLLAAALAEAFGMRSESVHHPTFCDGQDVSEHLIRALLDHLVEGDPMCDHSVGICACSARSVMFDLELWLARKALCGRCGGDGIGDVREVHVNDPMLGEFADYEHVPCEHCDRGYITIE